VRHDPDRVVIALSKVKLSLMVVGALLFVAGGVWLLAIADTQTGYLPIYVKGVAILAIGFFGLCALYGLRKLSDGSPGLVLDREGIMDNSSGIAVGRVAWREIRDVQVVSIHGQRFLALFVGDHQRYLGGGNLLSRLFRKTNYRWYGTPIVISAHGLKVTFRDLETQIRDFRARYGS
jgi:hypothetical protein